MEPVIAIVDDDRAVCDALRRMLTSYGLPAMAFGSAEQFLGSRQRSNVSCLILDMRMPGMTGMALHQRLMADSCRIPTILITASPTTGEQEQAIATGVVSYLAKPISEHILLDTVRGALELSNASAAPIASSSQGIGLPSRLRRLEAEAIGIFREVAAEFRNPVLLYSIGKDSSVLLHLARKAFYPAKPPFPLLHVDTTWKFREMIAFRDALAQRLGLDLIVHTNREGLERGISPIASGSALHTQVMKTDALKQALDRHGFDAAIGGARRDEEKSRAKERVFSLRGAGHTWEPRRQRPELWHLYNTRLAPGETMRVFPLSNWTELDVWDYIVTEQIDVVPLYFAKRRPVVLRDGVWIMVDDDRLPMQPGETPELRSVRFRTLGCYPLTGAIESEAATVADIVAELRRSRNSEREGRLIDSDDTASMERKKRQGYF